MRNQIDLILTWSELNYVVSTDFSGHFKDQADKNPPSYEDEHGHFGFGLQNEKSIRLLDFALPNSLEICGTYFKK